MDTNTLASGAVSSHGPIATLITAWQNGAFDVLLSNEIYVELQRTLGKPYFTTHLSQAAKMEVSEMCQGANATAEVTHKTTAAV